MRLIATDGAMRLSLAGVSALPENTHLEITDDGS